MGADGLEGVRRAARVEAAPPDQQAPHGRAIAHDHPREKPPRGGTAQADQVLQRSSPASANTRRISSMSSEAFESPKGPRATRIRSNPSLTSGQSARQASRSRRRARLRATAPPTRFPVTQAAREGPGRGATYTTTRSDLCAFPSRRARRIAGVFIRSRVSIGPSCAGDRGWSGRRGCASSNGSRVSASVSGCWAGRCASWSK